MAEYSRELSHDYWRPAQASGAAASYYFFQSHNAESFCDVCGTGYAVGAHYCHQCGRGRESDLHLVSSRLPANGLALLRADYGISAASVVALLLAVAFLALALLAPLLRERAASLWQAENWRIQWLLATVAALLSALIFKARE